MLSENRAVKPAKHSLADLGSTQHYLISIVGKETGLE